MGVSGINSVVRMPITTVTSPRLRNIIRHPESADDAGVMSWKAYDTAPPRIWPIPRPRYQNEKRGACSDLVYHWLLMRINDGPMVASKIPRNTRDTRSDVYPVAAAPHAVAMPQAVTLKPSHFAAGKRWRK